MPDLDGVAPVALRGTAVVVVRVGTRPWVEVSGSEPGPQCARGTGAVEIPGAALPIAPSRRSGEERRGDGEQAAYSGEPCADGFGTTMPGL